MLRSLCYELYFLNMVCYQCLYIFGLSNNNTCTCTFVPPVAPPKYLLPPPPPSKSCIRPWKAGSCTDVGMYCMVLLMTICGANRHSRRQRCLRGKVRRGGGGPSGPLSVGWVWGDSPKKILKIKCSRSDSEGT